MFSLAQTVRPSHLHVPRYPAFRLRQISITCALGHFAKPLNLCHSILRALSPHQPPPAPRIPRFPLPFSRQFPLNPT